MARMSVSVIALAALFLILGVVGVGCGPKPPCQGASVTQVQAAADECTAAQGQLATARETRAGLEQKAAETKSEIARLTGQPEELSARLEELKKGSGR
jgi:hypothetical protein